MQTLTRPESPPRPQVRRDIRHLVVCGRPIRPYQSAAYLAARALIGVESLAGDDARIVLVTGRWRGPMPLPFDVAVDVLPVFAEPDPGRGWRIDRGVLALLFASVRPNTLFHVHDSRHPILIPILQGMRALGIAYRGGRWP